MDATWKSATQGVITGLWAGEKNQGGVEVDPGKLNSREARVQPDVVPYATPGVRDSSVMPGRGEK